MLKNSPFELKMIKTAQKVRRNQKSKVFALEIAYFSFSSRFFAF